MLFEWLQYLATPCPKHLRAMGYPQEIIATQARYQRCREAWRPHLENTKAFILESAAAARGNRIAVVLGSGMLLDVPLAELSQGFAQVILVDILHLPWVKRRARRYPNVRFLELDVTGTCEILFDQVKRIRPGQGALPGLPNLLPEPLPQSLGVPSIDFLASVNLLSQLPILPQAFLEGRCPAYSDEELQVFSHALIENHLAWLKASAVHVCVTADKERVLSNSKGDVIEREDALFGVELPAEDRSWIWRVAPQAEWRGDRQMENRVVGISHCSQDTIE